MSGLSAPHCALGICLLDDGVAMDAQASGMDGEIAAVLKGCELIPVGADEAGANFELGTSKGLSIVKLTMCWPRSQGTTK